VQPLHDAFHVGIQRCVGIFFYAALSSCRVAIENIYDNVYPSTEIIGVAATLMIQASATMPHFNTYMTSSTIGALYIQGEYTSLLFRVDQHVISTVR
jgi:hypothetical protein